MFSCTAAPSGRLVLIVLSKAGLRQVILPPQGSLQGHSFTHVGDRQRNGRRVGMACRMVQNGAPTHEIERQGRWKQGGGMVVRYTCGETAGSDLRYL